MAYLKEKRILICSDCGRDWDCCLNCGCDLDKVSGDYINCNKKHHFCENCE